MLVVREREREGRERESKPMSTTLEYIMYNLQSMNKAHKGLMHLHKNSELCTVSFIMYIVHTFTILYPFSHRH